jgi:hypothetical protein
MRRPEARLMIVQVIVIVASSVDSSPAAPAVNREAPWRKSNVAAACEKSIQGGLLHKN